MTGYKFVKNIKTTDVITVYYIVVTAVYMLIFEGITGKILMPMVIRALLFLFVVAVIYVNSKLNNKAIKFIHLFYPIILLTYFYGETAQLNHLIFIDNLDPIIYRWEEALFGFQPSLKFSVLVPQYWFSELMNFGYFSYYLLTFGLSLAFFIQRPALVEKVIFMIISSFLIYYFVFIVLPVVGPQYYFSPPLSEIPDSGIFSRAVKLVQYYGEHPTGAFPSSHIGMVVIFLYISYSNIRWFFWIIVPLFLLILLATVYIKAHYAVDLIAGLVSAPIVYYLSGTLFKLIKKKLLRLF
ncbi:MAG: phosphatase PAP2 family protein [Bacteroidetes bacterium]|nr:phosphatase PAP2 family protein [Bacteroidota bacterium]MBL6944118.1 phosphatase PAP2 family protein [Bacteroidales bacterium]